MVTEAERADAPSEMPAMNWSDSGERLSLVCHAIRKETPDAKTYIFGREDNQSLAFKPGQFLTFFFNIDGRDEPRCYSLSCSATRTSRFSITVKRVKGGLVSNWLFDQFKVGDKISAAGPAGLFTSDDCQTRPLLFLSAGSGITPLASMMRSFVDLAVNVNIAHLHFGRSPDDMIFLDEMTSWSRSLPGARIIAVSEPAPGAGWVGPTGLLCRTLLEALVPDFEARTIFCCGPEPFMTVARSIVRAAGIAPDCYREESFTAFRSDDLPRSDDLNGARADAPGFMVDFVATGRAVSCERGRTVLEAARAAQVHVQTSCGRGLCGTCRIKLKTGTVEMSHAGGIRQREIDEGWILACCSRPTSDLVIDK